jgi:cytochrome c peroxidase
LNLAWGEPLFWDGRAQSLEDQALGPIASPAEMNLPLDQMIARLKAIPGYQALFAKAYPNEPISEQTVSKALATFERTVVSGRAPFDHWVEGNEGAISAEAKRGFLLFNTKANCVQCHNDWRFTDDGFHDIGLSSKDLGRGQLFREIEVNQFAFKAPTLRNVDQRAPYMHDGSLRTLEAVLDFYDRGGEVKRPSLSPEIKALNLTALEKRDLLAFLKTLTSVDPPTEVPTLPQ